MRRHERTRASWTTGLLATLASLSVTPGCATNPSAASEPDAMQVHHTIDYIEIPVSDLAEAKRFYGEAFGWTFNDYGPEYAGIVRDAGGEVGGMRLDANVVRGGVLVILFSDDLEASRTAVVSAGGNVVVDIIEFPGGRRFQFTDPAGNELAVWSNKASDGSKIE